MKTRIVIGSLVPIVIGMMAFQVLAQRAENDDMYFNSKDREKSKVTEAEVSLNSYSSAKKKKAVEQEVSAEENVNPTNSYSSPNVNPEYVSRSNSTQASEEEQNYYVEGYTPNTYDSYSSGNYNNYNNNWNNNNWNYGNNYNSWYSPYYGYCNPWMSPYYSGGPGWMLSLNYTWGNIWSPGWSYGLGYGWGNSYYNPYRYYPSYYSPYYSGYPTYYYSGGSEASGANYGKRPSRHSAVVTPTPRSTQRVSSNTNGNTRENRSTYSTPSRSGSFGGSTPSRSSGSSSTPKPRGRD